MEFEPAFQAKAKIGGREFAATGHAKIGIAQVQKTFGHLPQEREWGLECHSVFDVVALESRIMNETRFKNKGF